jgi:hypothetical protein
MSSLKPALEIHSSEYLLYSDSECAVSYVLVGPPALAASKEKICDSREGLTVTNVVPLLFDDGFCILCFWP